jgi:hypothetical protein
MTLLRVLLLIACALLGQGCGRRHQAERQLRDGGTERLRHDAAMLYMSIFTSRGRPDFVEVWYRDWPASFEKLAPLHVGAYLDGISIALSTGDHSESGLFIVPESMDHRPVSSRGANYERITEGIYWYSFGE